MNFITAYLHRLIASLFLFLSLSFSFATKIKQPSFLQFHFTTIKSRRRNHVFVSSLKDPAGTRNIHGHRSRQTQRGWVHNDRTKQVPLPFRVATREQFITERIYRLDLSCTLRSHGRTILSSSIITLRENSIGYEGMFLCSCYLTRNSNGFNYFPRTRELVKIQREEISSTRLKIC